MATETTALQPLLVKEFYDRVLLERTSPLLVHDQFGQERNIPANAGKTISFRRFAALAANTTPLVEGTPPAGQQFSVSEISATIAQYGDFIRYSDLLHMTTMHPIGTEAVQQLGDQAGESLDIVTREAMVVGTNVVYADAVANRAAVDVANVIDWAAVKFCATQLANSRAMKFGTNYVGIIHPYAKHTLTNDTKWVEAAKYAGSMPLYTGEIGSIEGVRFVESSLAKVFTGAGAGGIDVYATLIMGQNAYGRTRLENGALQQIVKAPGSAGTKDPLDQEGTWAWKATKAAKILNDSWLIRLEHSILVTA